MSNSGIAQGPMNILRNIHEIMHTEFSHLDVQKLYEYVDKGAEEVLGEEYAENFVRGQVKVYEDLPSDAEETDRKAMRAYERNIKPHMKAFSTMMEVISPHIVRYNRLLDALHAYVKRQKRQSKMLRGMVVTMYVFMLGMMVLSVFTSLIILSGAENKILRVLKFCIAGVALQWLLQSWRHLMDARVHTMDNVDLSMFDKYRVNLGKNIYVLYADAYARGVHKEFAEEYAQDQYYRDEDALNDPVFDKCRRREDDGDRGESGVVDMQACTISPCEPGPLHEELAQAVFRTWATRPSLKSCGRAMLTLLEALAEVHSGEVFQTRNQHDMWHAINDGVERLRRLVYRRYDVDGDRGGMTRDSALSVIKRDVLPIFKLDVVESRNLASPLAMPEKSGDPSPDLSVKDKLECWDMCLRDENCRWACYHPDRGCIRSTKCGQTRHGNVGCVDVGDVDASRLIYDPDEEHGDGKMVTLVKRDSPGPTYVCGKGARSGSSSSWTEIKKRPKETALETCENSQDCKIWERPEDSSSGGKAWSVSWPDKQSDGNEPEHYKDMLTDNTSSSISTTDFSAEKYNVCVKSTPGELFRANERRGTFATFYAFIPKMVDALVDVLKKHYGRIRLEPYRDYIHVELAKEYKSSGKYDLIRPLVDDVMRRVEVAMNKLRIEGQDASLYISPTRFENKLKGKTHVELWKMTEDAGELAKTAKLYIKNFPSESSGTGDKILRLTCTTVVVLLLLIFVYYNVVNAFCYREGRCSLGALVRGIVLSLSVFAFVMVIMASVIMRYAARSSYNGDISQNNGRLLVTSAIRVMELQALMLEYNAAKTFERSTNFVNLRHDFIKLYEGFGHFKGAERLKEEDEFWQEEPRMQYMYLNIRNVIEAYDKCNSLTGPRRMPYPVYEVVIYSLAIVLIVVILAYSFYRLDPLGKARNINRLNEVKSDIKMGMPAPPEFKRLMECCSATDTAWTMVINLAVLLLAILTIYVVYTIAVSSRTYRLGLYSSGLYKENRCTP